MKKSSESNIIEQKTSDIRVGKDGSLIFPEKMRHRWNMSPGSDFHVKETPYGVFITPANPPLSKIYLEPTTLCNLKCRTCVRNSWTEPTGSMEITTFHKLLADLSDVQSLRTMAFWGIGEPLVHPNITEMVGLAHKQGLKTELITNALLLNRDMARGLIQAGLDTLVVSVDGVTSKEYADIRCGGELSQVQENVNILNKVRKELNRKNPEVGVEFVVMRQNLAQLPELRKTAFSLGARFIMLTNLLPYTEDMKDEILYTKTAHMDNETIRSRWFPEFMLPRMDMLPEYMDPLFRLIHPFGKANFGSMDHAMIDDNHCPFILEGSAAVTWTGDVSPCIALMHSYRCFVLGREKSIRQYTIGNVADENMTQIWNKQEYSDFRSRVKRFDFPPCIGCGGCEFSESNEEDCFGNPHPVCGDCLWAKRVILCP